jgi:SAM-dependent methyltransferase
MHHTAAISGLAFAEKYGGEGKIVVDIGGQNVNGSLRNYFTERNMKYICVDIEEHPSVDIVVKPGDKLPFSDGEIDLIVSVSCFEHDPLFWMTFKEMCRITKLGGYIFVNAPSNGAYHCYPGDNWRFYSDAGQALAYWSGKRISEEEIFPSEVIETFHILPSGDQWLDFICIWKRVDYIQTSILVSTEVSNTLGILETYVNERGLKTIKKLPR